VQPVKNIHDQSLPLKNDGPGVLAEVTILECPVSGVLVAFSQILKVNPMAVLPIGEKIGPLRDFAGSASVSSGVQSAAVAISLEQAEQSARENAEIARGLKRQDPELLDHLIELYQHRLLRYLMFLTGKREVAEDLFQETWMRVLLRGGQYNGKARFDTWLFTIARNLVIDLSRKRTMASLDEMSDATEDGRPFEIATDGPSPLDQFKIREDRAEVSEVLMKLEANYREVLLLRFHEELSLEEIAAVTKAPLSTVKSRLYRGLAALKPEIERLRGCRNVAEATR
jgi:RNA polymerase sigma-70 factor, ECF subfamily